MSNRTDEEIEGIVRDIMENELEASEFVSQLFHAIDELDAANAKIKKYESMICPRCEKIHKGNKEI